MVYSGWEEFKRWAMRASEVEVPPNLRAVVKTIREYPELSLAGVAGVLEENPVRLLRLLKALRGTWGEEGRGGSVRRRGQGRDGKALT